jgi:glucose/arabinose dehydrogenase
VLHVGVGSNSNITENGMEAEKNRAAIRTWQLEPGCPERLQGRLRALQRRQAVRHRAGLVTGVLDGDGRARGRPVGIAVDKSSALLNTDDVGNTIWRVTASDQATTASR